VVAVEDNPDETLSIDRLSAGESDIAPVIRLVDTPSSTRWSGGRAIYTSRPAMRKWRSSIALDGVLHYAMPPIAKDWHSTILSRVKVMSELDIAGGGASRRTGASVRLQEPAHRLPRLDHADHLRRRRGAARAR